MPISAEPTTVPSERADTPIPLDDNSADAISSPSAAFETVSGSKPSMVDNDVAGAGRRDDEPLVTEALKATGEAFQTERSNARTLKGDVRRLSEHVSEITSGAGSLAAAETRSIARDMKAVIRERPLAAVGLVAAIAFALGASR